MIINTYGEIFGGVMGLDVMWCNQVTHDLTLSNVTSQNNLLLN